MINFDTKRDKSAARLYWQTCLQDYSPTSLTWSDLPVSGPVEMRSVKRIITSISAASLSSFAQERNVTSVVIMQAAWAALLSNETGTDDVAFGVVVSGRNVQVDGVVEMAGNSLNTISLRVTVVRSSDWDLWLQKIYQSSIDSLEHHHHSLEEIIRQSGRARIFETVLIFENRANRLNRSTIGLLHLQTIEGREFLRFPSL